MSSDALSPLRPRSPPYPAIPLATALRRAGTLLKACGKEPLTLAQAGQAWGLTAKSGKLPSFIAALSQYGLTEDEGRGKLRRIWISDAGERLIRDRHREHDLLKIAALTPQVFREIWHVFGTTRSGASDEDIVTYLTHGREARFEVPFTQHAARDLLRNHRANVSFVNLTDEDKLQQIEERLSMSTIGKQFEGSTSERDEQKTEEDTASKNEAEEGPPFRSTAGADYEWRWPFTKGRQLLIQWPHDPNKRELEIIKQMLSHLAAYADELLRHRS